MAVVITFDLKNYKRNDHSRLKSMFERFGWENLGGTAYRYPRLGTDDQPVEDWLNHVVPAMMLFRAFLTNHSSVVLTRFTIDTDSSAGYNPKTGFGSGPLPAASAAHYSPVKGHFGKKQLRNWLDNIPYPY
ncbi:hypothetical protein [Pseudomonas sp.]|jgi:hypothetical protein|uniref:hypothetical protein n=1 Tax=Pseudomonas sp. TaxID=306 RepID=UPI003C4DC0A8